jgi:general secretion pathway protein D
MAWAQEPSSRDAAMRINLKEVEIAQVADAVAEITGKNFVIDPRVKAKVSFVTNKAMSPQKLYQTFLTLLKVHGFAALDNGDIVEIVPVNVVRDRAQPVGGVKGADADNWITEVVVLKHVSANKLVALLRPLIANEGHLVANPDSNRLIVTDRVANIARLRDVISRVDVPYQHSYEVIALQHLSAEEAVSLLKSLNTGMDKEVGLVAAPDTHANRLILSGGEAQRLAARALIAQLDTPVKNQGRVQVVYLQYAKAADLAPILQSIAGASSTLAAAESSASVAEGGDALAAVKPNAKKKSSNKGDEEVSIEADERMNALVISASPQLITTLREVIKKLDVRRAQVIIEAVIAEISEDQKEQFGAGWVANGPNGAGVLSLDSTLSTLGSGAAGGAAGMVAGLSGSGATAVVGENYGNDQGWGAFLRALKSNADSNILSTPTLVTMDNEEASMIVGQEVPFSTGSYSNVGYGGAVGGLPSGIGSPFQTIKRQDVGLKLKVKPQINEGDSIRLEIEQSVSSLVPNSRQSLGAVDLVTSKREIKTNVLVNDGQMVVLGGLIDESETESLSKVPGLGDIPVLGNLFSYKDNKIVRRNLMVFLRPRIVRDDKLVAAHAAAKYKGVLDQSRGLAERKQTRDREISAPSLPDDVNQLLVLPPPFDDSSMTASQLPKGE